MRRRNLLNKIRTKIRTGEGNSSNFHGEESFQLRFRFENGGNRSLLCRCINICSFLFFFFLAYSLLYLAKIIIILTLIFLSFLLGKFNDEIALSIIEIRRTIVFLDFPSNPTCSIRIFAIVFFLLLLKINIYFRRSISILITLRRSIDGISCFLDR